MQNARFIRWSWDNGREEKTQQYFTNINLLLWQCSYILHSQTFGDPTDLLGNILTEEDCIKKNEQSTTVMCYLTEKFVSKLFYHWMSIICMTSLGNVIFGVHCHTHGLLLFKMPVCCITIPFSWFSLLFKNYSMSNRQHISEVSLFVISKYVNMLFFFKVEAA